MIVTQDDFNLIPYNLVGLPDDGTFDNFISEQEELYLRPLLGNLFYDALVAGIESLPDAYDENEEYATDDEVYDGIVIYKSLVDANMGNAVTDATKWEVVVDADRTRWLRLIEGESYEYSDRTYKWFGLKKMVRPLIWSLWTRYNVSADTAQGKAAAAIENANRADNFQSICDAWNKYVDYSCGKYCIGDVISMYDSLYGYLYVSTSFDDLDFGTFETLLDYIQENFQSVGRMNAFGI